MKKAMTHAGASDADDFRVLLRDRLRSGQRRNPRASLRALAHRLGVDHSTLSQLIRGKRRLTAKTVIRLGKRLGMSDSAIEAYAQRYESRGRAGSPALAELRRLQLDADAFQRVAAWHHSALLELTHLVQFRADSRWVANTLGMSVDEVNVTVQRLARLGLIELAGTRWIDRSGDAELATPGMTDALADQLARDGHEVCLAAIDRTSAAHRIHNHMMIAIESRRLPRLRRLVDELLAELRAAATGPSGARTDATQPDDVYQIAISLVPVTTLPHTEGKTRGRRQR